MRVSFAEGNQKDIQGNLLALKGTDQGQDVGDGGGSVLVSPHL